MLIGIDGIVSPTSSHELQCCVNLADMVGIARLLQGPSLKWHKEYSDLDQQAGRVLMIDFARSGTLSLPAFSPPNSFI